MDRDELLFNAAGMRKKIRKEIPLRKLLILIVTALMLVDSSAFAEDSSFSVGVSTWFNSREFTNSAGKVYESDDPIFMYGPTLKGRSGNVFYGLTYLVSGADYEYTYTDDAIEKEVDSMSRRDLDLVIGYMFSPYVGVYAGYKRIKGDWTYDYTDKTTPSSSYTLDNYLEETISGPGFGVNGSIPVSDQAALYGSFAWMALDQEYLDTSTGATTEYNLGGIAFEFGGAFLLSPRLNANVGYKYQSFEDPDYDWTLKFSGLTAGLNLIF